MLIVLYLSAIVAANLLVAQFGASVTIISAFLFIGLDLSTRDALHEKWGKKHLWVKMLALIATGSILSAILNYQASQIALASFLAFAAAGISDTLIYQALKNRSRFTKMNGSNIVAAAVDSVIFPLVAFGYPLLWGIVLGQFIAKTIGGLLWALILQKVNR